MDDHRVGVTIGNWQSDHSKPLQSRSHMTVGILWTTMFMCEGNYVWALVERVGVIERGGGVFIYARVCAYTSKFEHERACVFACVP